MHHSHGLEWKANYPRLCKISVLSESRGSGNKTGAVPARAKLKLETEVEK